MLSPSTSPWWHLIVEPEARILSSVRGDELPPGVDEAILVPLRQGTEIGGYLVVTDRLGDVDSFAPADLKVIETLATHVAVYLENGRLEQSLEQITALKDRLEELVRAKDQFVAIVSHELRTPLTGIVGLAEELRNNRALFTEGELDELLSMVASQGRELAAIVEDLLVAARAEIGTLALRPESIDLASEIADLASAIPDRVIETRGLERDTFIWADPLRFRQIVRNLLTNVGRYGGPDCWIEVGLSRDRVRLAVVDNGPGVPTGMEEEIFEPYAKADNVRIAPGSAGLGLSVARKLARAMDGDLIYQRRRNGLTVFELILPKARVKQPIPA
jgi:signal transduction histidine kinase